jgi:predicted phosphodiesterase
MRSSVFAAVAAIATCALGWSCAQTASAQEKFSIALLPDTQNYAEKSSYGVYAHQTQWIVNNRAQRNLKFAVHLGDITQHNLTAEWQVASAAHQTLDNANFPYSMVNGNHDLFPSAQLYKRVSSFSQYFGPTRFSSRSWYGGYFSPTNDSNFTLFEVGALKFMVVSLEFVPRKDVVTWANQLITAHPDRRVIIATHCHVDFDGNHTKACADNYDVEGREGIDLWEELISRHSNIFLAVSGHVQGVAYNKRTGLNGNVVHEILTDFQDEPVLGNGTALGNGWLRVLNFDPALNQIAVETLSVEAGNFAIFANGAPTFYLSYDKIASPTADQHNLKNYSFSYGMGALPAYAYSVGDLRFKDRTVNTSLAGKNYSPRVCAANNGSFYVTWQDDRDANGVGQIYARGFDKDGNALFTDKVVNTVGDGEQRNPDIACDDAGNFAVVWEDDQDDNGSYQILARGFLANGNQRFADISVNSVSAGQQYKPSIGMDSDGDFVVAWEDDQDGNGSFQILARGFNATGAQRWADKTINSNSAGQQFKPSVALDASGDFVVAWEDDQDNNGYFNVYARGFTAAGAARIADFRVNSDAAGQHSRPSIALDQDGDFIVAWEDDADDNGYYQIRARGFAFAGSQKVAELTVNTVGDGQQFAPAVAMNNGGEFVVAWEDDKDDNGAFQMLGRGFNVSGTQKLADFTVNSDSSGQQYLPSIAFDEQKRFVVGWQDDMDGDGNYLILARNFNF